VLLLREARTAVISQKVSGICFILEKGRLGKKEEILSMKQLSLLSPRRRV